MSTGETDFGGILSTLAAALGGGGAALMIMRRRLSRDGSEIAKDRAEVNLVATLQSERDAALAAERSALAAHTDDARSIERLTASNEYLTRELARATKDLVRLRGLVARLAPQAAPFMASTFGPESAQGSAQAASGAEPRLWGRRTTDRIGPPPDGATPP